MAGRTGKHFQGKRIVDAKHPLTITVKEEDIRKAKRANPGECAIARCMMRDKHVQSARIGARYALIEFDSHFERYKTDSAAKAMVEDFDNNGVFASGEYKLLPPPPSSRLTGKAHARSPQSNPGGRRKDMVREKLERRPSTRSIFRAKESPK